MSTKNSRDAGAKQAKVSTARRAEVINETELEKASGGFILEYTEYGGLKDVPKVAPKTKKPFDMGSGTV